MVALRGDEKMTLPVSGMCVRTTEYHDCLRVFAVSVNAKSIKAGQSLAVR